MSHKFQTIKLGSIKPDEITLSVDRELSDKFPNNEMAIYCQGISQAELDKTHRKLKFKTVKHNFKCAMEEARKVLGDVLLAAAKIQDERIRELQEAVDILNAIRELQEDKLNADPQLPVLPCH